MVTPSLILRLCAELCVLCCTGEFQSGPVKPLGLFEELFNWCTCECRRASRCGCNPEDCPLNERSDGLQQSGRPLFRDGSGHLGDLDLDDLRRRRDRETTRRDAVFV